MAYKDSSEIATDQSYALGEYSFRVERSAGTSPNYDKIEAICTKGGKNARKSIQVPSNYQYKGYYVEANETTADVYAVIGVPTGGGSEVESDVISGTYPVGTPSCEVIAFPTTYQGANASVCKSTGAMILESNGDIRSIIASSQRGITVNYQYVTAHRDETITTLDLSYSGNGVAVTIDGKTAYYLPFDSGGGREWFSLSGGVVRASGDTDAKIAWSLIYGNTFAEYEDTIMLIGRFAIELEDAGGVGPGSDWVDPGDYDPDWEPEEPTHTLYVTVTGALSGRHNDPIEDPSYSYIPADKDTVKDYGCGGDGGHGGGGGAGASTVVVHKFATNQANSKEITTIARRHGYGSGGGKGGKGGDGCILIYY